MIKIKINRRQSFVNAIIFALLYFSFDTGVNGLRWSKEVVVFTSFACAILLFGASTFSKKTRYSINATLLLFLIFGVNLFNFFIFDDVAPNNMILMSAVSVGYLVSVCIDFDEFKTAYLKSMVFLCFYSLVATYVFLPLVMRGKLIFFPTTYNLFGVPMSDMYFAFGIKYFGLMRNQGLFREPGVFQIFILVALLLSMYQQKEKYKNRRIFLFLLTMLTTFSAVGIVLTIIVSLIYYFPKLSEKPRKSLLFSLLIVITIALLVLIVPGFQRELLRSLAKWGEGSSNSFTVRFNSLLNALRLSFVYPLTGMSFNRAIIYIIEHFNVYGSRDLTATTMLIFSCMGIPMGILLNRVLYGVAQCISKQNILVSFSSFIVLLVSINSQNILCNNFFWIFFFVPFLQQPSFALSLSNEELVGTAAVSRATHGNILLGVKREKDTTSFS